MSQTKKNASAKEPKCKDIQDRLQKENSILEEMLNGTENMHLVYLDRNFNFVRVNEAYAKTCGYKPEEMIGKNHFALYPGKEVEAIFKRVRDTGVPTEFHDRPFVFPDQPERGVTFWDWTLNPVKNKAGKIEGLVFSLVETTERKKAEERLKRSEARYRSYIEVTGELGWTANAEGEVIEDLPSWRNFTGQTLEEIMGSGWSKALRPDDLENTLRVWKQAVKEKSRYEVEYRVRRHDGVYRHFLARGVPVFQEDESLREWVGTCIDITERKKAEEMLQEQSVAISSAPDAIFSTDSSFIIKSWNGAAERIFGWEAEEVIGKASTSIFSIKYPTLDGVSQKQALKKLMDTGFWQGEVIYRKKDGSPIPVSVSVSLVKNKDGNVTGTVAVVHDISKRKRREEALRRSLEVASHRSQELERLQTKLENKAAEVQAYATHLEELAGERAQKLQDAERMAAIGATAGMVGHDIRNPLQAIIGDLYLITSEASSLPKGTMKETIKESIQGIRKSVEYIDKIVQDLQDYATALKPDMKETNFEEIIQEILLENSFPKNISAKYIVEDEAKEFVCDATILKRILSNLVSNAVQAMPDGGDLMIQTVREANEIVISVQDSGVGIAEEFRAKLFTPLFTTKAKGQGFGLPVVKRMTEALGGTVTFESNEGKGTKFIIRLPNTKR